MEGIKCRAAAILLGAVSGVSFLATGQAQGATIEVDFSAVAIEDGDDICSLREAMISASKNVARDACEKGEKSRDTIKLRANQFDDFFLTGTDVEEDENKDGDLDYTGGGPLTINGKRGGTVINAVVMDNRVLHASGNASALTLKDLQLVAG